MARPLRIEYPGAFYHVTSRGNQRGDIFNAASDRRKFLEYVKRAHERFKIVMHAYCLIDNHYHFLIQTLLGNLSRCMQYINSGYTTYFNRKSERVGHLFQGRYKAILIEEEAYLARLSRYIHLNPVRAKIVEAPEEYPWSSYRYYVNPQGKPDFLDLEHTLAYFDHDKEKYRKFVEAGLTKKVGNPLADAAAGIILGRCEFVEEIKEKFLSEGIKSRDLPQLRKLKSESISPSEIIRAVSQNGDLRYQKQKNKVLAYLLRKYTDNTLEELAGKYFAGMSAMGISSMALRLEKRRGEDEELNKVLTRIETKMRCDEV